MNVVDSSCWLEYFAGTDRAALFQKPIAETSALIVPSVVILEVFRTLLRQVGKTGALNAAAHLEEGMVVVLDSELARSAAQLGQAHKLPLADSVILATARAYDAVLWTMDAHFRSLPKVRYFDK